MTEKEQTDFIYAFYPFMFGIYPYTVVTAKQKEAMETAEIAYPRFSIYNLTCSFLKKLLSHS
jgi:hypothetical protein